MTVKELIAHLQTFPQDLQVAYRLYSEQCLMESCFIEVQRHCVMRGDGWIQDYREDKPSQEYLMFPGH